METDKRRQAERIAQLEKKAAEAQRRGIKYSRCCCLATDCIEQFINLQNPYCLDNTTLTYERYAREIVAAAECKNKLWS
ncbi:hypothetical protein PROFUN_01708 [Planoprotostelium fungivorum]|uniref:Uncharacterized protein n=1 Tax=Planoprotostelium fungivorum TaxID=1890364 RepID=A0A2P6MWA7_9EUKA|nr:hypothetical protein PROFUN_01708 [Planoprotostelium fungivorum]